MSATPHAQSRARERYGVAPEPQDWADAVLSITSACMGLPAPALLVGRCRKGHERWVVRVAGVAMLLVYAPQAARVVTVLSPSLRRAEHLLAHK